MKTFSKNKVRELFESKKTKQYMKFSPIAYRLPFENETLVVTCGGRIETVQKVKENQIVVMALGIGTEAETYAIDEDTFRDKYETSFIPAKLEWFERDCAFLKDAEEQGNLIKEEILHINQVEWHVARPVPKPTIDAFKYEGEPFKFIAPWGEEMICYEGDMLARTIGKKTDIYRIEKDAFSLTYKVSKKEKHVRR